VGTVRTVLPAIIPSTTIIYHYSHYNDHYHILHYNDHHHILHILHIYPAYPILLG
jgi:hypothetical protein